MSCTFKPDVPDPPDILARLVRALPLLALVLVAPAALSAQGDSTVMSWLRFRVDQPLELHTPAVLRSSWVVGPLGPMGGAVQVWDSLIVRMRDSTWAARTTAWRLRRIYGRRAEAAADSLPADHGILGVSRRYADLNIDGTTRIEILTEKLKNLRCTSAQFLDPNSGCRGGFKPVRLDTYLSMRAGGLIGRRFHVNVDYDTERDFSAQNNIQVYYEGLEDEVVRRVEVGTVSFQPPPSRFLTANIPANNFGINATFQVGALRLQGIAATQKGSVVAERSYVVGSSTVQPQDREVRDLDYEANRFFWVVDPAILPGYPAIDILSLDQIARPPEAQLAQADVRVYRYRPAARAGLNPNLGGIGAIALGADTSQRVTAQWELLQRDIDFYVDPTGLWIALAGTLDDNDYLAVSYRSAAGQVGTFPAQDHPFLPGSAPQDTLRLIVQPRVDASRVTFRHEMRQIYAVAGADLDVASLKVQVTLNRSERPLSPGAQGTYLGQLGLATATDAATFNSQDRLFPRAQDPNAALTVRASYIVYPTLRPFADSTRLTQLERNDSLYRTPRYLLFSEGPPAKFVTRLRYDASSSGDRSSLDLGALQIRDGSEVLYLNGRRLARGVDYNLNYGLGQVTFLNPQTLFGNGTSTIQARFEERGTFVVAPTQIYGLSSRYSFGETGGINLMGIYQVEQTAYNRPALGFEASAQMMGGVSTDLRFRPEAVTRFLNHLTSSPTTAPSHLDIDAEVALSRPDPNRSGQAYLEEFEGDPGVQISLRESAWQFSSRPQFADSVEQVVGPVFDTADAVQLTLQNLVPGNNGALELRATDIDDRVQIVGQQDQLETVLWLSLQADTAGGLVRPSGSLRWKLPTRFDRPRWRSIVSPLSATGTDLSRNEYLEFWVYHERRQSVDSAGVELVFDLGNVNEDAVALAPESLSVVAGDTTYTGRQLVGLGQLDTEREETGVFNAAEDDNGILGDRPPTLRAGEQVLSRLPLCRQQLTGVVSIYQWGDLAVRCSNGNGLLDTEDLDGDNQLNTTGQGENVFRWVVDLRNSQYFVRNGVQSADSSGWRLYRIPLRRPGVTLGAPNLRLIKQLRLTVVAQPDNGTPDVQAFFALARMRMLGAPWVRRSEKPVSSLAGATAGTTGEVVASTVSTEDTELGYVSPPGVVSALGRKGASKGEFGTQINERSLRLIARQIGVAQRAEAYFRFPSGPQNLLRYRQLRLWARGRGPGWNNHDFQFFFRVGTDSRNFYQYATSSDTTMWEPELVVDLDRWRALRAQIETQRLRGPPDSAARVACGGDTVSIAYVVCDGPYLVYIEDPAGSPPNLARVQELAAGVYRLAANDPTDSAEVWVDDIRLLEPIAKVGSAMALSARLGASDVGDFSVSYIRQDGYFQQIGGEPSYRTTGALQVSSGVRLDRFLPVGLGVALPAQVSYARTTVDPQLLDGTDIQASDLKNLRRPEGWVLSSSFALQRTQRGRALLVRGLVDPLSLTGSFSNGRNVDELSQSSSSSYNLGARYQLSSNRHGVSLDLGGLVRHLPGFVRKSAAGEGLNRPFLNLAPSSVRLASGLTRSTSDFIAYDVPVSTPLDSLRRPITALSHLWRNGAGLTWQPLGMLALSGDLASTRDLRRYPDSTSLGRIAEAARKSLFGLDVGVERDRQLSTSLNLTPRISSWLTPRYLTSSSFVLSRSLASRQPVQEDGDSGAFILPQTLNNSRTNELGAAFSLARLVSRLAGDSNALSRVTRHVHPLDLSDRITRSSTFDLASFDPGLGYQLGLGGLGSFLRQQNDSAIGVTETRSSTVSSGAELPLGISLSLAHSRVRSTRLQQFPGGFISSETIQREWPKGNVRFSRTLRRLPVRQFSLGATFRVTDGSTVVPSVAGPGVRSLISSSNVTPDAQVTLTNGMVLTFSYQMFVQRREANGTLTRLNQNELDAGLTHAFQLPKSISASPRLVRALVSGVLAKSLTCLRRQDDSACKVSSDTRRTEVRANLDTDLSRILTGGLQMSYSINEARHLDQKFSQLAIWANFQLSLFAGDYR